MTQITKNKAIKDLSKNIVFILLIFLFISGLFALFARPTEKIKEISLTQLTREINQGNIKRIIVINDNLSIFHIDETELKSRKEVGVGLSESLINLGVNEEKLKAVEIQIKEKDNIWIWLGPVILFLLPLFLFIIFFFFIFRQAKAGAMQAFNFSKARARLFGAEGSSKEKIFFKDVAGLKEAKEELMEIVDFLKNPKKYLQMGAKIPRGVLLVGPPGCGKTMLAKAVASEAGVPFFSISGSEFIELFVGVGSSRVRDLFLTAKKAGRSIIFIDELDAIGRARGAGIGGGHDEREQTLNQILVEMDGFERDDTRIVLSASVTGDTPVLIKQNKEYKLLTISEVVDPYYQENEEKIEKSTNDLEVLGFERKLGKAKSSIYFQNSAFKKVRSVFRHKVNEIYEVRYNGGIIKTTGNHSVFIRAPYIGLKPKLVAELQPGDLLVNLPLKVSRTNKEHKEIRAHKFNSEFNIELLIWQPLFKKFESVEFAYQYALTHTNEISQTKLGKILGFSQRTIGKWQQKICGPRVLSRNYYQHQNILPEKVKVTPELMRLFGYYAAEGYARKELDFCLNRNEKEKIDDIKNLIKEIFNLKPSREKFITSRAINIVYHCKPLASFFAYHCGKGAKNKHVPQFIFEAPFEYFKEFFKGYLYGDGYIDKLGRGEVTSVSKQLILELNWLFTMHGFKSYIYSFQAKEGRKINNGKPLAETTAWRLGFGKTQNPLNNIDTRIKGSVYGPVVKSIKKIPYEGYVYDFCGCENEAFFGGESPVLLHNTNRPDILDPALLRPGRFDRKVILDIPDINDREEILKIHCQGKPLSLNANLREIAERTPGFSGADLANMVNEAAILAARKNKHQIFQGELLESIEKVLLGPERKSHVLSKREKEIAAFHEAGHALVSSSLPQTEPIRKISIIARGMAAGYTLKTPSEDRKIKTKTAFLSEIATLLGGYCAEKLKFKEITTGATNDLERASELARKLVKEYGMSALGPISFGEKEELVFLGKEISEQRNYSEKVAARIDKEVEKFIKEAEKEAEEILSKKKNLLEKIAKTLIEKETIEKEEFEKLINSRTR
jgi:ATP-dependent Zn protease